MVNIYTNVNRHNAIANNDATNGQYSVPRYQCRITIETRLLNIPRTIVGHRVATYASSGTNLTYQLRKILLENNNSSIPASWKYRGYFLKSNNHRDRVMARGAVKGGGC